MITTAVVVLGAFSGGFVTGLAGFGTGLTALAFWLHVVNPTRLQSRTSDSKYKKTIIKTPLTSVCL